LRIAIAELRRTKRYTLRLQVLHRFQRALANQAA
jgi:hypothetical protein